MIVVMATGNTAIMDMSIFEGFRAMSANIAVEMPETEVNSTHYRILFLGALVLFGATFFLNTIAEVVRQRLRTKYSSL
jgi:phosphate transport system permease protein